MQFIKGGYSHTAVVGKHRMTVLSGMQRCETVSTQDFVRYNVSLPKQAHKHAGQEAPRTTGIVGGPVSI